MSNRYDRSHNLINQAEINELFSQITAEDVEQFYQTYQIWSKHQQIVHTQQEISIIRERQAQNAMQMQNTAPSAVALSTLAQLRASGVEDVDLLDKMLERGEEWLDHTMQLLERCEELNVIRGNYTQWCEHALEGAYEWMDSMDDASLHDYFHAEATSEEMPRQALLDTNLDDASLDNTVTEDQLLRKLMSEDGNSTKKTTVPLARITQDLPPLSVHEKEDVEGQKTEDEEAGWAEIADEHDFPFEIEEPEIEPVAGATEEQARARVEQQRYQGEAPSDEPSKHAEDLSLFPVDREEPAETMAEIVDQAQLLPTDIPVPVEGHASKMETPTIEESVSDDTSSPDSSMATNIQADELTRQAFSDQADVTQQDETNQLVEASKAAVSNPVSVDTTSVSETIEQDQKDALVDEQEVVAKDTVHEPIIATTAEVAEVKEESPGQWPFAYQEIEDTSRPASLPDAVAHNDIAKRGQTQVKRTQKKPRNEASQRSLKKRPGFFRRLVTRLLARIFRR